MKVLNTVDLFCGAGGASTGMEEALARRNLKHKGIAINHWKVAVETMKRNHGDIDTKCMSMEAAVPGDLVPGRRVHILWASPSCFTAGHLVTTDKGQKPIEDIKVGDMVLTHKGRWRKVVKKFHRNGHETVKVQGAGHFGIECTPQHKFWMRPSMMDGKHKGTRRIYEVPQWMPIERALANEALWATPIQIEHLDAPELPEPLATMKDPWWVIGRWLGDGWVGSGRHFDVSICCQHGEEDMLREKLQCSRKWAEFSKRTTYNFTLTNKETMDWFVANFGHGAAGKYIPSWALTMPREARQSLFDGYMSADGNQTSRRFSCATVSRALAVSLRMLAEGLGHRVGFSYTDKCKTWHIEGRSGPMRPQYKLHWNATLDEKRSKESFEEFGMVWSRVRSCVPARKGVVVYNIEVEEDHSYVLDGIVVKNCTHHSRARGGKPRDNQNRAQPQLVDVWLDQLYVDQMIIENVPEFIEWGPLNTDGTPNKKLKGACFKAWVEGIKARGYDVDWKIVNCADYGDATTRKRFFLKAVKKGLGMKICWPEPQFAEKPFGKLKKWRGVKECLDLSDTGKSIFGRKKPLSKNTLRRIMVGLKKFNGLDFQMDMLGSSNGKEDHTRVRQLDLPLPTQHAGGNRTAIVRPFIVKLRNHETAEDIEKPLTTVTTSGAHHMLCQPVVVDCIGHGGKVRDLDEPIGTQCTHDRFAMVTPLIIGQQSCAAARSADKPCPTIATAGAIQGVFPVLEDGRIIDIRIRMLKPSELAAAHSFPKDYVLTGNRGDQVKQIGNSVPVMTAAAMCESSLMELKI